ncbi:laccase-3-like [Iris pallida]|uniref:laccase n=1 Tax=Iris pallida TaxID=29817 RepID=A0AAX6F809_IRIPA|nr:laccase-3-like [Iris pallida]
MEALRNNAIKCFLSCFLLLLLSLLFSHANAEDRYHDFVVQETQVKRLCNTHNIITVNGMFPGPTVEVNNGDTLIVNVKNKANYNVTIHWHGVRQMRTGWADGPEFVTQCPIRPGGSYTYRFTIQGQEGTLWWHAHSSWLRATVYGALIIHPKDNTSYPFTKPKREAPVILGEWWNANPIDVVRQATKTGAAPNTSDAFTINGEPGDLYKCSSKDTTVIPVAPGETNLLRFINAALNTELFVSIAGHSMTVVAVDASYTKPFTTNVLMLGPGQTTDVLISTNQPPSRYYIAARAYASAQGVPFDNTTTTAILDYVCSCSNKPGSNVPPGAPDPPGLQRHQLRHRLHRRAQEPEQGRRPVPGRREPLRHRRPGPVQLPPGADVRRAQQHPVRRQHEQRILRPPPDLLHPPSPPPGRPGGVHLRLPFGPAGPVRLHRERQPQPLAAGSGDQDLQAAVRLGGPGGAAGDQHLRGREPPDPYTRLRLLHPRRGVRELRREDGHVQVQPSRPADEEHGRGARERLGGDPVRRG